MGYIGGSSAPHGRSLAMARPIITFTSDFGRKDWFAGVVHGVLHQVCPEAHIVDLTHDIPPGNVARAAFLLEAAAPDFPAGTVHLAVVDPGVGGARRALAVVARGQVFVGPDNGILEWALRDPGARAWALTGARWFRQPVSRTFHARDVFAPVAAHLAGGVAPDRFGPGIDDFVRLPHAEPEFRADGIVGCVLFVDHFGNALTNIDAEDLARAFPDEPDPALEVRVLDHTIRGLARSYGERPLGTVVALVGSSGRLEFAQVGGDCATRLGIGSGDRVQVRRLRGGVSLGEPEPPRH
jgi:S-adenosyl-L-methionine hydrolase (adenosine-forming)